MHAPFLNKDFAWGAAISAAQTESANDVGGKGPSIWDEFCDRRKGIVRKRGMIRNNDHISGASDFYTHYKADIDLLKKIGFRHFRFSIAWSRVLPDGVTVNQAGVQFYKDVVGYCIEQGITPWITLYHWDLPLALEQQGGWASRSILKHFERFAELCVRSLPTVRNWIIMNEPSVFLGAGYLFGIHAPGKKRFSVFLAATHHALLSIGQVYRHLKQIDPGLNIGSSFSFTHIEPFDDSARHIKAAAMADLLINRFFFEPLIGLGYPEGGPARLKQIKRYMLPGDEELLHTPLDFIGIQTYTREVFKHNPYNPFLRIKHVPATERSLDLTAMHWEMHPESLYHSIMKVHGYKLKVPLLVTENGAAFDDRPIFGRIHDTARIHYFQTHINEMMRAQSEGARVEGYFAWSLIDNFEWAEGYHPRFGLVYVDFETKERILKDSARWFMRFLSE